MERLPQKENDKKCQCKNKTFLLSRMLGSTESQPDDIGILLDVFLN